MGLDINELASKVRVSDGAWGTQLQGRGLAVGAAPELWNVENVAAVADVAKGYVDAGSDIIITNTFGANRFALAGHVAPERAGELAEAGARISRDAADAGGTLVFASIGPTGKIVMMDEVPKDEIIAAFAETAAAVARAGADAIVLESFAELDEIVLALRAAREATGLPVLCSMTFGSGPDSAVTMMGNTPEDLVAAAVAGGAAAVGANCGTGPETYVTVAARLRAATDLPIWMKPNAGLPEIADGKTVFPMGPTEFTAFVGPLIDAGANFIGGCCGTTPDHIRAVRAAVDAR